MTSAAIGTNLDEYVHLYSVIHDVAPYVGDPFFSAAAYRERLSGALTAEGFDAVEARSAADGLIAFGFGVRLPPTAPWWARTEPPPQHRHDADTGDVFWLRELQVIEQWRAQGIGRAMHAALLARRAERWATLTVIPDNEPARGAYLRWGYECIGRTRHADISPVYDVLWAPLADVAR